MAKSKKWKRVKAKRSPSNSYGLEDRQWLFCQEYAVDGNGTQAAIRAGYSSKTATPIASRLLTKVNVQRAIADLGRERSTRIGITADEARREWKRIGMNDPAGVLDFSGGDVRLRPANEITEDARRAIASIKVKRYTEGHGEDAREVEVSEFKFCDKLRAIADAVKADRLFDPEPEKPDPVPGSSPEHPFHTKNEHVVSPVAVRSFLDEIRRSGLCGDGVGGVPADDRTK